jgi:hypothetical protein
MAFRFLSLESSILPRDASKSIGVKIVEIIVDELPSWFTDDIALLVVCWYVNSKYYKMK